MDLQIENQLICETEKRYWRVACYLARGTEETIGRAEVSKLIVEGDLRDLSGKGQRCVRHHPNGSETSDLSGEVCGTNPRLLALAGCTNGEQHHQYEYGKTKPGHQHLNLFLCLLCFLAAYLNAFSMASLRRAPPCPRA